MGGTSLASLLTAGDPDRLVLRSAAGDMTAASLKPLTGGVRNLVGCQVGVAFDDPVLNFCALAALDGWVESLQVECSVAPSGACGPQVILTDRDQAWPGAEVRQVRTLDELLAACGPSVPGAARPAATRWLLPTSGTSGPPRQVAMDLVALCSSFRSAQRRAGRVWGCLYPLSRLAGLQVLLQAAWLQELLILIRQESDAERVASLGALGCTALSGTPSHWRRLLMTPGAAALDLRQVTLGGEIADATLLNALRRAYPEARIVHIYAAAELGVCFSVADGRPGFPVDYLPIAPGGRRLKIDEAGILQVGGIGPEGETFLTAGDVVKRVGDRYLFRGRASGIINIAGLKVHPEEVEACLLAHPAVRLARVTGRPNPLSGQIVVAEVVTGGGMVRTALQRDLADHCRARLERHKRPVRITIVDDLPLNAGRKLARAPEQQ